MFRKFDWSSFVRSLVYAVLVPELTYLAVPDNVVNFDPQIALVILVSGTAGALLRSIDGWIGKPQT